METKPSFAEFRSSKLQVLISRIKGFPFDYKYQLLLLDYKWKEYRQNLLLQSLGHQNYKY